MSPQNIRSDLSLHESFLSNFEALNENKPRAVKSVHLLLSQPRTGSTMVCDYLSKSSDLGWSDEWLNPILMKVVGEQLVLRKQLKAPVFKDVLDWILRRAVSVSGDIVINLQVPHIITWEKRGVNLRKLGDRVVYLRRRSLLEQAMSHAKARLTQKWHQVGSQTPNVVEVPSSEISKSLTNILAWEEAAADFLQNRRFFEIFYEELLADRNMIDSIFVAYGSSTKVKDLPTTNLIPQQMSEDRIAIERFLKHIKG